MSRKYQPKTKEYAEIMVVTSDEVYDDRGNINSNYELIGKVERELPNFVIRTNNRTKKSYYVEDTYVNLSLSNTEDWGDYTLTDYTVRIVPYNTDDYDFYYKVNDTRYTFSSTSDLSAGFTCDYTDYDGNGLQVSDDGTISFYINNIVNTSGTCNMKSFLTYVWYHSFTSSFDRVALLTSNPDFTEDFCFAICVYSPDNEIALEIPFRLDITDVAVDDDNGEDSSGSDSDEDSSSDSSNLDDDNDDEDVDISYSILTYEAYSGSNDYTLIYDGPTTAFAEETVSFSLSVSTDLVYISDVFVCDISENEITLNTMIK